jgi:SWI/SNF-related matrix-associated actin-dependent regulator of chromatin subfamily A-like protein 1
LTPELREYQQVGASFLRKRNEALLADEMGLGKSAQVLTALRDIDLGMGVLIVCPASLKLNWVDEIEKFRPECSCMVHVMSGRNARPIRPICIVNYDILSHVFPALAQRHWGVIIADEMHYAKNPGANRTRALVKLKSTRRWALTGTPVLNRPIELYPILWWLRQPIANSYYDFGLRYCGEPVLSAESGRREFRGATRQDELRKKLDPIMLRRLKCDVLDELPPKTRQIVRLEAKAGDVKLVNDEARAVGLDDWEGKSSVAWGSTGELAKLRSAIGRAKAAPAAGFVQELLEEDDGKVIVFAHHRAVMDTLEAKLAEHGVARIDGSTSLSKRMEAIAAFQSPSGPRVFLGQIMACGTGINLTAASTVVMAEYEWTPGVNEQAEDRAHRIGQKNALQIFYLVVDKTVDVNVVDALCRKTTTLKTVLSKTTTLGGNDSMNETKIAAALRALATGLNKAADALTSDCGCDKVAPEQQAIASPAPAASEPEPAPASEPEPQPAKAAKRGKKAPAATPAAAPDPIAIDDAALIAAATNYLTKNNRDKLIETLGTFGAKKVSEIKPEDRPAALKAFGA